MCAGFAGDELKSLTDAVNKLTEAFAIDEDQESKCHAYSFPLIKPLSMTSRP